MHQPSGITCIHLSSNLLSLPPLSLLQTLLKTHQGNLWGGQASLVDDWRHIRLTFRENKICWGGTWGTTWLRWLYVCLVWPPNKPRFTYSPETLTYFDGSNICSQGIVRTLPVRAERRAHRPADLKPLQHIHFLWFHKYHETPRTHGASVRNETQTSSGKRKLSVVSVSAGVRCFSVQV